MPTNSKDVLGATLVGVVVGGIVGGLLDTVSLPFSNALGAFVGGAIAAYVLYAQVPQAARAGALSGVLSIPFYLGVGEILYVFGAIPPQSTTPPMSELQVALGFIFIMNLGFGAFGGILVGAIRHPAPEAVPLQPGMPGTVPEQLRYCVQCGAQLPSGAVVCPQCNARQPT